MGNKKVIRTLISLALFLALAAVLFASQSRDPSNPHSSIPKEVWIHGPQGHGYAVKNNQQPAKQCYPCHTKKGLGGYDYCHSCHVQSGTKVDLPR